MRITPPPIEQPQGNTQNPTNTSLKETQTEGEVVNNGEITTVNAPSLVNTTIEDKQIFIRNKRAYNLFKRLVKQGRFTNAVIASKITGVSRQTIVKWLDTKMIREAMSEDVNKYISTIAQSKDWKAQAYLLDKVIDEQDNVNNTPITLNSLIQINI